MTIRILEGHILDVLAREPAGSVHCAVTSPPYLWLRAYGTEPQVWDGAEGCEHEWGEEGRGGSRIRNEIGGDKKAGAVVLNPPTGAFCTRCGAWRGELGQEPTPELFVEHLVAVFRAVRRVLRDDGTLWVNLAGCYWNDAGGQNGGQGHLGSTSVFRDREGNRHSLKKQAIHSVSEKVREANRQQGRTKKGGHPVYKALDYVDVPGLVARALQADGWLWRSDVALVKSAPMPESVSGTRWERCRSKVRRGTKSDAGHYEGGAYRDSYGTAQSAGRGERSNLSAPYDAEWADCRGCPKCAKTEGLVLRRGSGRPTRAWERLLMFAKRAGYYYDTEAVREKFADERMGNPGNYRPDYSEGAGRNDAATKSREWLKGELLGGRNARDWLLWRPQPLKAEGDEAEHYAAFPTFISELAVKAGTSERGCCPGCGAPWARVVETRGIREQTELLTGGKNERLQDGVQRRHALSVSHGQPSTPDVTTLDWRPTCACPPGEPVPCTVMDCFGGSGTSGIVADRLGRDAVLVELKPAYARLAERRLHRDAPLLMWGQVTLEQSTTPSVPEGVPLPLEALEEPQDAVAGG